MRKAAIAVIWSAVAILGAWPALAQAVPTHFELEVAYCLGANAALAKSVGRLHAQWCAVGTPSWPHRNQACAGLEADLATARDRAKRLGAYLLVATPDQGLSIPTMLALTGPASATRKPSTRPIPTPILSGASGIVLPFWRIFPFSQRHRSKRDLGALSVGLSVRRVSERPSFLF